MNDARGSDWIRARRDELVANTDLSGRAFGRALAASIDDVLRAVLERETAEPCAVVALGSYARGELCPGSDVDILLLHDGKRDVAALADRLWYPLWDAGFVLGHATRTAKESLKLAERDLDTLTGLLEARVVGGPMASDADRLIADGRALARRRRQELVEKLSDASRLRRLKPGLVAEMLEPNLKDGSGGLRDLQAMTWAGWTCSEIGGHQALADAGVLRPEDLAAMVVAGATLLDARVALHRVTGGRSDVLALQEQDSVAAALGFSDADAMVRDLAAAARGVAWVAEDAWTGLRGSGKRRKATPTAVAGVERRGSALVWTDAARKDGATLLATARLAAVDGVRIDRSTLVAMRAVATVEWNAETRADFIGLLRAGAGAIDVFEALDHEDLVTVILPEWANVRYRPQRNAYHRFTVDRHLLETVAEAVRLLDDPAATDAFFADELTDPTLLLLGALLHDIAKGRPGDHSDVGATVARALGGRMGFAPALVDTLAWLVADHLLMADTATRRDLADPVTIERFAARVGSLDRLAVLTLLTVADSRATGPAAWGRGKAALVRELADRTAVALSHGAAAAVGSTPGDADPAQLADRIDRAGVGVAVSWEQMDGERWRCTVGADDRPGLLADVAGALSLEGFDIETATGHSLPGGRAAEIFEGVDTFDRLGDVAGQARAERTIAGVLAGEISVVDRLAERRAAYPRRSGPTGADDATRVNIAQEESDNASVVEVYAPDEIGLLATVSRVFGDLGLDVAVAKVATTGELAVDVFYVRDGGAKISDDRARELAAALLTAVQPAA